MQLINTDLTRCLVYVQLVCQVKSISSYLAMIPRKKLQNAQLPSVKQFAWPIASKSVKNVATTNA